MCPKGGSYLPVPAPHWRGRGLDQMTFEGESPDLLHLDSCLSTGLYICTYTSPCPPHSAPPAGRASARTGKALGDLPWEPLLAGDQGLSVMMVREGGDAGREGIIDEGILYPTCMRTERTNYSFQSSFLHTYFSFSFMVFVLWIKIRANEMR